MKNKYLIKGSVSRKYSLGYIMLSVVATFLLVVSFLTSAIMSTKYKDTTNELLYLNELYVDIEAVNSSVNTLYLYLRVDSYEEYKEQVNKTKDVIIEITENNTKSYTREVVDTIYTIETYIKYSDVLMEMIINYSASTEKSEDDYNEIRLVYAKVQETLNYINLSFQSTYSKKLISARAMQEELDVWQKKINTFQIFLLLFGVCVCAIYSLKVIKDITCSIGQLTKIVNEIENNVYQEVQIEINSDDEFDDFAKALNHMIEVIQKQMRKIEENAHIKEQLSLVEKENLRIYGELQKNKLTLLQSRMNPHFLFNTLNMISSLARMENAIRSAELMEITATYLRYNLNNLSKSVTFLQEVNNLKDYITIQQYRFEGRYSYNIEVDPACESHVMPCMILQPLVENSIKHGMAMMSSGGKVWIKAYKREHRIYLEVKDNGTGIDASKIKEINKMVSEPNTQSEHIGLRNIYMRLNLFYEGNVEFKIASSERETVVSISLPDEGAE